MLKIPIRTIYTVCATYLLLPLVVWLFGWLRGPFSLVSVAALALAFCFLLKTNKPELFCGSSIVIDKRYLIVVLAIVLLWCLLGGQCGVLYQTEDWDARNAIYRDLITHEWPVVYSDGSALCYYFGYWLIPSLFGKALLFFGVDFSIVWVFSNFILFAWTCIGIMLCLLLFFSILKKYTRRAVIIAVCMFVFFSGMDIVGMLFVCSDDEIVKNLLEAMHIEWWAKFYQFSSMTTQLFWVFNQAVPAWLLTFLIISTKTVRNDIFLGILGAFLCPLPTIGLVGIGIAKVVKESNDEGMVETFKALVSPQNLLALIPLLPILLFMFSNQRASGAQLSNSQLANPQQAATGLSIGLFDVYVGGLSVNHIMKLLLFALLEYGVFFLLLFPFEKKNPYWWGAFFSLLVVNVLRIGPSGDFAMRASIPALVVLLVMLTNCLVNRNAVSRSVHGAHSIDNRNKKNNVTGSNRPIAVIMMICLVLGGVTPLIEIERVPVKMIANHECFMTCDNVQTFEGAPTANFNLMNYDQSRFCRYVGKT